MNRFQLQGKVALITGGSKGLGKAMARGFAEAGADILISSRHEDELKSALKEILQGTDRKGHYFVADMAKRSDVKRLADQALAALGRVDILINNAGTNHPQPIDQVTDEDWDRVLEINLSSVHGFAAVPSHAHYEASKGGINLFTKACAIELAPHDIQVNAIAPGAIEVERYHGFPGYDREDWGRRIPAGRVGWPADIGPLAAFLCSPGASYLTGQIIWVDGGMTSRLAGLRP